MRSGGSKFKDNIMNPNYVYNFFGKVFPERAQVGKLNSNFYINAPAAGLRGKVDLSIDISQIIARFTSSTRVKNPYTLRNYVEDVIRLQIDIYSYLFGCGFDIEITSLTTSFDDSYIIFGVNVGIPDICRNKRPLGVNEILSLCDDKTSEYIRRSLSDLRQAHRNVRDAGFFCYRSIESLKRYFVDISPNLNDKDSWELFRRELEITRSELMEIKNFSDPVRHGGDQYISAEEYLKMLEFTRVAIDKFLLYVKNELHTQNNCSSEKQI